MTRKNRLRLTFVLGVISYLSITFGGIEPFSPYLYFLGAIFFICCLFVIFRFRVLPVSEEEKLIWAKNRANGEKAYIRQFRICWLVAGVLYLAIEVLRNTLKNNSPFEKFGETIFFVSICFVVVPYFTAKHSWQDNEQKLNEAQNLQIYND